MTARPPRWSFPYLGHGVWDVRDEIRSAHWYLVFHDEVPLADRADVRIGAPPPVGGPARWAGPVLLLESPPDRFFDDHVWRSYGPRAAELVDDEDADGAPSRAEAQAFVDAVDAWLGRVHAAHPLTLVVGSRGNPKDPWSRWSAGQVPRLVPALHAVLERLRPPSEPDTRDGASPERLFGWAAWRALAAWFETHEATELAPADRDAMRALAERGRGYDPELDLKFDRILRMLAKADPS